MADERTRTSRGRGRTPSTSAKEPHVPQGYAGKPRSQRSRVSPARKAALEVVRAVRERNAFAQDIISQTIDKAPLSREDRAFATRLALGVVSSSGTLDDVINRALRSPTDIQDDVRDALRLSTYEIIFLNKSAHAAVDQGVELTRTVTPKAAGLANATLRKIVELRESFPFGDPTKDIDALARLHAFPSWLAKRLVADLGPREAVDFMRASNDPAPLFIAVNALKATDDEVRDVFASAGVRIEPEAVLGRFAPGCYRVPDGHALLDPDVKQLFAQGKILVSDAASQAVAHSVLPQDEPSSFLEVGAGRATKTILLQSNASLAYGHQLELTALDNRSFKTALLLERARRYGAQVAQAVTGDALDLGKDFSGCLFGQAFVDAPCSGLGTLRRHPEIRWRLSSGDISRMARRQLEILDSVASHVAVGGILSYATCTVTHAENNGVVKAFLEGKAGSGFKLVPINGWACFSSRLVPDGCDAHFAVQMVRWR